MPALYLLKKFLRLNRLATKVEFINRRTKMNSDRLKNLTNSLTVGINFVSERTRAASRVRVRAVARRRPPSRSGLSPSDSLARASSPSVSATSPPIRSTDNKHQVRPLSLITAVLHVSTDARWPTGRGRVSGPARFRRTGRHGWVRVVCAELGTKGGFRGRFRNAYF